MAARRISYSPAVRAGVRRDGTPAAQYGSSPDSPLVSPPRAAHPLKPDLLRPEGRLAVRIPFAPAESRTNFRLINKLPPARRLVGPLRSRQFSAWLTAADAQ